jgi:hypothetical protein
VLKTAIIRDGATMTHLGSMRCLSALVLVALSVCHGSQARAGTVPLYNTGVDSGGVPLDGGSIDPHWSIVDGPGIIPPTDAFVLSNPPGSYAESPASGWIWVNPEGSGATGVPYTFRLSFDLTGFDAATATISGSWGVDNNGSIDLNGSAAVGAGELSLSGGDVYNFTAFHDFSITGGFVAGINTLDFLAEDDGNPGALNVTNLVLTASTSAVPEPGSAVLAFIAVGVLGVTFHQRIHPGWRVLRRRIVQ